MSNGDSTMTWYEKGRNISLFVLGALILFLEIEWHEHTRGWVIALALLMMGIVTVDQVKHWFEGKHTEAIKGNGKMATAPPKEGPKPPTQPPDPPL